MSARSESFADGELGNAIQRIYVINLDRQPSRWHQMSRELGRLRDHSGQPLSAISRRFSAVDARFLLDSPCTELVHPEYTLADQLFVQPEPRLDGSLNPRDRTIKMTRPEVAVALSHIEVWKLIADGDPQYTLVLEDDVFFRRGFAATLDDAWNELMGLTKHAPPVDLVYLSYDDAGRKTPRKPFSELLFMPLTGLWQLSGYVLSKQCARKLLDLLPVRGPVDLWMNHQFNRLTVFATREPIIEQRHDVPSSNSYSVLPILSEVGVITREKPLLVKNSALKRPVFAFGDEGSGLTSLASALSILGYRCCSDFDGLPEREHADLFGKKRSRIFDAYVNVGALNPHALIQLAKLYPKARFILTAKGLNPAAASSRDSLEASNALIEGRLTPTPLPSQLSKLVPGNVLELPDDHNDKWELLCRLLDCEYPAHVFPECEDRGQRRLADGFHAYGGDRSNRVKWLKKDASPWIVPENDRPGLRVDGSTDTEQGDSNRSLIVEEFEDLDAKHWLLRDDTFPSNLALFKPQNFEVKPGDVGQLTLRKERTSVRLYTSASIATRHRYRYGRFGVEVKPTNTSGLVTGVFLHRNAPRQEIDLEFLGRDTTKLLANVYFNPGDEGTKLEYGYRGAPALIDLGFDASLDFHQYEIEWHQDVIRWRVDGRIVHERLVWGPTPIPHLPMQFNVNLWHSRSKEFAGKLVNVELPAHSYIKSCSVIAAATPTTARQFATSSRGP